MRRIAMWFFPRRGARPLLAALLPSLLLAGCAELFDPAIPRILDVSPAEGSNASAANLAVSVAFSAPMDRPRTEKAFSLTVGGARVETAFRWVDAVLVAEPRAPLQAGFRYAIEVLPDAVDTRGMRLKNRHASWFTVGTPGLHPGALLASPAGAMTTNRRPQLTLAFSRPMDPKKTEEAFSISPDPGGHFAWADPQTLNYVLHGDFSWFTEVVVRLGAAARDADGYGLEADFRASFTCGFAAAAPRFLGVFAQGDARAPVSERYFGQDQGGVSRYLGFVFHFSAPVDRSSFESGLSFNPSIDGRFEATNDLEGPKILFHPSAPLSALKTYRLTLSGSIKNAEGQSLGQDQTLAFTTDGADSTPPAIETLTGGGLAWALDAVNAWGGAVGGFDLVLRWSTASGVGMDIAAVQQSTTLSRFAGVGGPVSEGTIRGWIWDGEHRTATLSLTNLAPSNYYRLRFASGVSGCRDTRSNTLAADSQWLFYHD